MPGLTGEVANLIVSLKLDDRGFSGKLNTIGRNLGKLDGGLSQMGRGVGQVGSGLARLGTVAAAAAAGGLAAVVATAVSFEDAFAGVVKTVDASEEELDQLRETFREMAREIPVSFESLSALGETAGALGIAVDDIEEFVKIAATLGVTTDVAAEQAATSLGVLSNVLGLTGEDYERFADVLVRLGNEGASTESAILAIAERAGAGATLIGIAADDTLAWSAAVANLGIEVEAGGTAIQKFFVESLRNLQDDDTLEVMAETAGVTAKAFKQAFEKDASGALRQFVRGLGELENAERLAVLEALGFSDIRITRALLGLAGNVEGTEDAFFQLSKAEGAATKEAEKRFATTASQIQRLKNNVRDAAFIIGSELLPVVNELIKDFVGELNKPGTQAGIAQFAKDLAAGVRGIVGELKGTDFSSLIGGMKLAAEVAGKAFDLFKSLPAPVQQLAIAALVANKVSGGAVGQIAKGLGNILLGGAKTGAGLAGLFGGRGASPANPMFVAVTNQIPGAGGPVVGPASGAGLVIRNLLGVTTAVGLGAILGNVIGRELFFNPTVAPAKEFESKALASAIASADPERLQAGIDSIDDALQDLKVDILPGGLGQLLFGQEIDELQAQRGLLVEQLARAKALEGAQKAAIAKYGEGAAKQAAAVESLKLPLGLGNVIAGQIRSLGAQQVEQARQTRANTAESKRLSGLANSYLSTVAAKDLSPTINMTNTFPIKIGLTALATQVQRVRIAGTTTIGGFTETAF